ALAATALYCTRGARHAENRQRCPHCRQPPACGDKERAPQDRADAGAQARARGGVDKSTAAGRRGAAQRLVLRGAVRFWWPSARQAGAAARHHPLKLHIPRARSADAAGFGSRRPSLARFSAVGLAAASFCHSRLSRLRVSGGTGARVNPSLMSSASAVFVVVRNRGERRSLSPAWSGALAPVIGLARGGEGLAQESIVLAFGPGGLLLLQHRRASRFFRKPELAKRKGRRRDADDLPSPHPHRRRTDRHLQGERPV